MLQKLKHQCGFHAVSKMAVMFSDMGLSKELMREFRASAAQIAECHGIEFTAEVLSQGHWPEQARFMGTLP